MLTSSYGPYFVKNPFITIEEQLENARRYKTPYIDLSHQDLTYVDMSLIPDTCETLCLQDNHLRAFPKPLPPKLKRLIIDNNELTSIPEGVLPPTLEYLCASWNQITKVPSTWPPALRALYVGHNSLSVPQEYTETTGLGLETYKARLKAEQDRIEEEASRHRITERVRRYGNELLQVALHPDRIDKWVQAGAFHNLFG